MCKLLLFINFERGFRGKFNKTVEILSAAFNLVEQHNSVLRWRECKKRHSQTLIDLFVSKFTGLQLRSKLQPALIVSTNILCVVKIRDCYALFAVGSVRDKIYANFAGFNTFLRSSLSRSRTLTGDCLQDKKRAHPAALHISNSRLVAWVTKYGVFIQKYCFKWHQILASANLARWTKTNFKVTSWILRLTDQVFGSVSKVHISRVLPADLKWHIRG